MGNQPLTIPHTKTHRFESKTNGVEYELFVALPPEYQTSKSSYPVIFTTDPTFIFPILCGVAKSLYPLIPESIIVGIGHTDLDFKELDEKGRNAKAEIHRARDFLPYKFAKSTRHFTHDNLDLETRIIESSGQAENFKDFITTELIPFIDKTYKTNSERTLIGHSFGGIFTSFMMLKYPNFFQNYLVISPILNFEDGLIFNEIIHLSKTAPIKIYFCAGSFESGYSTNKNFLADLKKFHDQINSSLNITAKIEIFEDEYHCTVVPLAISKGLRFLCKEDC